MPLETLASGVGAGRVLLLVDNCEHLLDACAALAQALLGACPALKIIATSRELLGVPGEHVYETPPLGLPAEAEEKATQAVAAAEAVQLFVTRARERRSEFVLTDENAAAVAQICRRLDGLPLAIELAAARVGLLSPAQIAAHLDRRFALLTDGRGLPARHQTLRAAIDWSWDLLDEQERTLFARLSVLAGDFGLEAAQAVGADGAIAAADVLELLGRLVDKSLVVVAGTRRDDAAKEQPGPLGGASAGTRRPAARSVPPAPAPTRAQPATWPTRTPGSARPASTLGCAAQPEAAWRVATTAKPARTEGACRAARPGSVATAPASVWRRRNAPAAARTAPAAAPAARPAMPASVPAPHRPARMAAARALPVSRARRLRRAVPRAARGPPAARARRA
jgi:hypothetical protein